MKKREYYCIMWIYYADFTDKRKERDFKMNYNVVTDGVSSIRQSAREALAGKWGQVAVATLIYALLTSGVTFLLNAFTGFMGVIYTFVVTGPFTLGYMYYLMKMLRGEKAEIENIFSGFNQFGKAFLANLILMLPATVMTFVIGIPVIVAFSAAIFTGLGSDYYMDSDVALGIIGLLAALVVGILYLVGMVVYIWFSIVFAMTYPILVDREEIGVVDAFKESFKMMKGNKTKLFVLALSFIGWFLLTIITFGIASFWVTPYFYIAILVLYTKIKGEQTKEAFSEDIIVEKTLIEEKVVAPQPVAQVEAPEGSETEVEPEIVQENTKPEQFEEKMEDIEEKREEE